MPDGPIVGSISLSPKADWRPVTLKIPAGFTESDSEGTNQQLILRYKTMENNPNPKILRVLLRVDIQRDFLPGGALAVEGGDEIIPIANSLANSSVYDLVVDSLDSHPQGHRSFASQHSGRKPFDKIELFGLPQVLWPDHCIENSDGWKFAAELDQSKTSKIIKKGQDARVDSYSAFFDNGRGAAEEAAARYPFLGKSTGLQEYIEEEAKKVDAEQIQIDVLGLALGFCVSYSALDASGLSYDGRLYKVRLIEDATRAIVIEPGDYQHYLKTLQEAGVEIISSDSID